MPKVSVNGVGIHYTVAGSGPKTLVLAHAYPTNHRMWAPQLDALSRERTVVAYDIRGFGNSDAPDSASAYSPDRSVEDVHALVDHLGVSQVELCGLSMGGNIALNFALAYPQRVSSLIVSGTGAGSDDMAIFAKTTNAWADAAEQRGMEAFANVIAANPIFAEYGDRGAAERTQLRRLILANTVRGVAHTAREVLAKRKSINALAPRLRELPVRTLVVIGEKDVACIAPANVMTSTIPDSRLAVVPGTGHFNNLEDPATLNALILEFLNASS
jgi:pimeloyl-ACP methyl ester carboxylesterase